MTRNTNNKRGNKRTLFRADPSSCNFEMVPTAATVFAAKARVWESSSEAEARAGIASARVRPPESGWGEDGGERAAGVRDDAAEPMSTTNSADTGPLVAARGTANGSGGAGEFAE